MDDDQLGAATPCEDWPVAVLLGHLLGLTAAFTAAPATPIRTGFGNYLCLTEAADVDAVHARALAAGATGVWEPATTEWGSYRCRVLDPEGFEWSFGTHRPGEPRDDWSEGKRDDTGDDRTCD